MTEKTGGTQKLAVIILTIEQCGFIIELHVEKMQSDKEQRESMLVAHTCLLLVLNV